MAPTYICCQIYVAFIKYASNAQPLQAARFLRLAKEGSRVLDYNGRDLRRDLLAIYHEITTACPVTYTRSDGSLKEIAFEEFKRRLFALSFDPHHCVERRWGADDPAELATCREDPLKRAWYAAQDRLRNQLVRTYGEPMGWSLAQMQNQQLDIGIRVPPDVDVLKVLKGTETAAVDVP